VADVKVGPDQEETDELRRGDPDDSTTRNKYPNQCLFVRTLNVTLSDSDWDNLNNEISIAYTPGSITGHETGTPSPSLNNQNTSYNTTQSTASTGGNFGVQRKDGSSSAMEFTSLEARGNGLIFSAPPTATVSRAIGRGGIFFDSTIFQSSHPSLILNDSLLKMVRCILIFFPRYLLIVESFIPIVSDCEDGGHSRRRLVSMYSRGMSLHSYFPTVQFLNYRPKDMTMSTDPEQILAVLSTSNAIREENGRCHRVQPALTYIVPYVTQESYISNPRCLVR
jgi:hypothetical protein